MMAVFITLMGPLWGLSGSAFVNGRPLVRLLLNFCPLVTR
jgi:hypothetical protein